MPHQIGDMKGLFAKGDGQGLIPRISALRRDASVRLRSWPVRDFIGRMGQLLYGRITPDGYPDRAEAWLSSGAMVARLTFAAALATNRLRGTSVDFLRLLSEVDKSTKDAAAWLSL